MPQATVIDEDTYPIAVACLPAGFALKPKDEMFGCVLVINHLGMSYFPEQGDRPYLIVTNSWMPLEQFEHRYIFTEEDQDQTWRRVEAV